jgi:hypothetical protein
MGSFVDFTPAADGSVTEVDHTITETAANHHDIVRAGA